MDKLKVGDWCLLVGEIKGRAEITDVQHIDDGHVAYKTTDGRNWAGHVDDLAERCDPPPTVQDIARRLAALHIVALTDRPLDAEAIVREAIRAYGAEPREASDED